MTYSDVITLRLTRLCEERNIIIINKLTTSSGVIQSTVENIMSEKTKNPKLKTLHKLVLGLGVTVSELLDFTEMNETIFEELKKSSIRAFCYYPLKSSFFLSYLT